LLTLPIDAFIESVRAALDDHRAAVLVAAPGAGKTTRVPPALADRGRVILLQPRRLAARAIVGRVAEEQGWTAGREIGWHIRFERRFAAETKLLVVTEGILTAYLQDDPLLSGAATLILDEFHERSVHADLGLALARQAWLARADLRILVMSATLDAAPVAAFLAGCPIINVPGSLHPNAVSHAPGQGIAAALDELLPRTRGNVLCFLPGAGDIARAMQEAAACAARAGADLVALHGSLDGAAQDAALSMSTRRRVIVATNIAETSLTVPGVAVVIDSGLHKVARYDAGRGVDSLVTERITRDSADQRAGRAARLGPGIVRRLWSEQDRLRPHREPEIHRIDLSGPLLTLLAWGGSPGDFEWFERPSSDRIAAAMSLLERLGAVRDGQITALGRTMQGLPLHPRLARVLVEARGSFEGAAACAWLSEPSRRDPSAVSTSCDLLPILDRWRSMPEHLRRVADQLERLGGTLRGVAQRRHIDEIALRRALLAGYPDRVARRRDAAGDRVTLATGHGAVIGRETGVVEGIWLVALDVAARPAGPSNRPGAAVTEAIVRLASRVERDWLTATGHGVEHELDATGEVRAGAVQYYGELVLDRRPVAPDPDTAAALLARAWLERSPDPDSERLLRRLRFAGAGVDLPSTIAAAAAGVRRLSDVRVREEALPWALRQTLDRQAPQRLTVPSGRSMAIEYEADGTISVSVKLQELFGMADTPRIGPRATPVTFHLLAPNGNPVQSTRDLKSFWERTYPKVRKELRGRYPRHPWPEDPWNATPTHRTTRGQARVT
jgi:ATP-dependent helicase HrpB